MAVSALPTFPFVVFGIVEPVLLVWAWYTAVIVSPFDYYASQVPGHTLKAATDFPGQALGLTLQMGNVLLLLAFLAVVCVWTPHASVARGYLAAVALADYGHIYAAYRAVGPAIFWDFGRWDDMLWGNVGASAVLNVLRLATVVGALGRLGTGKAKGKRA